MGKLMPLLLIPCVVACSTQRFGRQTELTSFERQEMSCRDIRIEAARNDAFLANIKRERSGLNGAQVLGILGDFGIGNALEGDEAESTARVRGSQLASLSTEKGCQAETASTSPPTRLAYDAAQLDRAPGESQPVAPPPIAPKRSGSRRGNELSIDADEPRLGLY